MVKVSSHVCTPADLDRLQYIVGVEIGHNIGPLTNTVGSDGFENCNGFTPSVIAAVS